ncbi:YeeE/YedE family protein [Emcibacter sp. SYSU 3D8]|uniref:YeeE/YedE family protein n=1 Tax=Emcibacter sp. SYSU 3D8 TaxID=3133969 RepID=UPI0031FE6C83
MEIVNFTPIPALIGGAMIGLASVLLMGLWGRIAGISGILGGLLPPAPGDTTWRLAFIVGLMLGGLGFVFLGDVSSIVIEASTPILIVAGLLVGVGTRLGSGCTSGHGVCGVGRLSPRGMVATVLFVATGMATVFVTRHVIGG